MLQAISQTLGEVFNNAPELSVPLSEMLVMVVLISMAAIFEYYRVAMVTAYAFLVNWVFVYNSEFLSLNAVSLLTIVVFLVLGVIAILAAYHQTLQRS